MADKLAQTQNAFTERIQNIQYDHQIKFEKIVAEHMDEKMETIKKNALLSQELTLTKQNLSNQID